MSMDQKGPLRGIPTDIAIGLIGTSLLAFTSKAANHFARVWYHHALPYKVSSWLPLLACSLFLLLFIKGLALAIHSWRNRDDRTPTPKGDRLCVFVARLTGDDKDDSKRRRIMKSVREHLGADLIEIAPTPRSFRMSRGKNIEEEALNAAEQGRKLLKKHSAHLLLWGSYTEGPGSPQVEIHFVVAEDKSLDGQQSKYFGFKEEGLLEEAFGEEFLASLAVVIVSQSLPAFEERGRDIVPRLISALSRLKALIPLIEKSSKVRAAQKSRVLRSYAIIHDVIGEQTGEKDYFSQSRDVTQRALSWLNREEDQEDWARTQNILGGALCSLGEREIGPEGIRQLNAALAAFEAALTVYKPNTTPLDWGMVQNNLGSALRILGERQSGPESIKNLNAAVASHEAALTVYKPNTTPLDWARAQNNLGTALSILGDQEADPEGIRNLHAAVTAYKATLNVFKKDTDAHEWAVTQNNLGTALSILGDREAGPEGTRNLYAAVTALEAVVTAYKPDTAPRDWARAQSNLGNAYFSIAERNGETTAAKKALACNHAALTVFTEEQDSYQREGIHENIALVQQWLRQNGGE